MARKKKDVYLTSEEQRTVKGYLSLLGIEGRQSQFIVECISYGIIDREFIKSVKEGRKLPEKSSCQIFILADLYEKTTPQITRLLLGRFSKRQRKGICATAGLGRIEMYVYTLLDNAARRGEVLRTKHILSLLERNFGADLASKGSVGYYKGIINRMRRKIWNEKYYGGRKRG